MKTIEQLDKDLTEATNRAVNAAFLEVKVAAWLLARTARVKYPTAELVVLQPSDQGEWCWTEGVVLQDGTEVEDTELDDHAGAATHLYWGQMSVVHGITELPQGDCYTLDIQAVIDQMEA